MASNVMAALCAIALFALLAAPVRAVSRSYDRGPVPLSDKASLHWTLDNPTRRISLALTVTDPGVLSSSGAAWIGLGISEETSGSMLGADIASVDFGAGMLANCTLADRHVPFAAYPLDENTANASSVYPNKDRCQTDGSWVLVACSRDPTNGTAILELERSLDAHDDQDRDIRHGDQALIFAYGGREFGYHGRERGSARVVLFNEDGSYPTGEALPLPEDVSFTHEIYATNYTVPSDTETTYACTSSLIPLPSSGKRVMIAADPVIRSASGDNKAHHLIVYACANNEYARKFASTADCMADGPLGNPDAGCTAFLFGWAVGAGRFLLPEGVGFEIDASNNFLVMESHYDNPDFATNAVDISGAKLYFADDRPIQAGMLALGDPAGSLFNRTVMHDFDYVSSCPSNCTDTWNEPINVFASFLHMHTTGRRIFTNRFTKNGTFAQTINSIEFWSNDHQLGSVFDTPRVINPGDKLSTSCVYDTRKRPHTKFGLETKDEMCIDFIFYYPLQRREQGDGAMFICAALHQDGGDAGTMCGSPLNGNSIYPQKNPTFIDTVNTTDRFGEPPAQCVVARTPGPTAAGSNDASATQGNSSAECFPGGAVVQTRRGRVSMRELQIDDEVQVGKSRYSRVFMFTHRVATGTFEFTELRTARETIALSAGHFLYVNGELKRAAGVRTGDRLRLADGAEDVVVATRKIREEGLYNPQTAHGDIVVNGIVASTYTQTVPPKAAHALLAPLRAAASTLRYSMVALEGDGNVLGKALRRLAVFSYSL